MQWLHAGIIFFMTWWVLLFAVLPFGVRTPQTPDIGHSAGAPEKSHIGIKLLVTTGLAIVITALIVYMIHIRFFPMT